MHSRKIWAGRLLSVSAVLFAAKAVGAMAGFLTHILLARSLSPDDLGQYFLVLSTISLAAAVAAFGYPSVMARFVSRYRRDAKQALFAAFVRQSVRDTLRNCLVILPVAFAWILFGPSIQLTGFSGLVFAMIAIAALSMMRINGSLATALRQYKTAYLPDLLFRPTILLGMSALAVFVFDVTSWEMFLVLFCLTAAAAALTQQIVMGTVLKPVAGHRPNTARLARIWRQTSRPFLVVTIVASFFVDVQLILVSSTLDSSAVAVVGICLRIAFLFAFVIDVIHELPGRDIGDALSERNFETVNARIGLINAISVAASSVILIALLVVGDLILSLFGPDYAQHSALLSLFLLPQLVRSLFGPNVMLLALTGAQRAIQKVYLVSLVLMAATIFVSTPFLGVMGSGLAVLVFFVVSNAALSVILYEKTGLRTDVLQTVKLLMAGGFQGLMGSAQTAPGQKPG